MLEEYASHRLTPEPFYKPRRLRYEGRLESEGDELLPIEALVPGVRLDILRASWHEEMEPNRP